MAQVPAHEIIIVPSRGQEGYEKLRQQCFDIRINVFHHEQKFPLDTELDDQEDTATHILLRLKDPSLTPVGTIRCVKRIDHYKLGRLAVLKDYRQYRFGRDLVLALHDHVKTDARTSGQPYIHKSSPESPEFVRVLSHSQIPVKGFYAKFGYEAEGEEFDEDGAPHQLMVSRLPLSDSN